MRIKSFVHHTPYTFSPLEGEPEGAIFGIFGYFRKADERLIEVGRND